MQILFFFIKLNIDGFVSQHLKSTLNKNNIVIINNNVNLHLHLNVLYL